MWAVGINTSTSVIFTLPVEAGGYAFGPLSIGYLYFAPIVGIMIGEVIGHFGNDVSWLRILTKYANRSTTSGWPQIWFENATAHSYLRCACGRSTLPYAL